MMAAKQKYADVVLALPVFKAFTYAVPSDLPRPIVRGDRVQVPFGRGVRVGWVVHFPEALSNTSFVTKPLHLIIDDHPIFSPKQLQLAQWISQYYRTPLGEVLAMMSPSLLQKTSVDPWADLQIVAVLDQGRQALEAVQGSPAQQALLRVLILQNTQLQSIASCRTLGHKRATIDACQKRGWLCVKPMLQTSNLGIPNSGPRQEVEQPELNIEQRQAVAKIVGCLDVFGQFVLDGVTGSGKTEVYCAIIQQVLSMGKQALVLVPEIGLTAQTVQRFVDRCGVMAVVMHSRLTERQKLDAWMMAKTGAAQLLIGTRSALFVPLDQLGVIVVDESHDGSYKQQTGCRYSARDVAMMWAKFNDIPILLGTATPSLETLYRCQQGAYEHLILPYQATGQAQHRLHLVDMRGKKLDSGVVPSLKQAMQKQLVAGKQVLLFLNRRGYAPILLCHTCGWSAKCDRCEVHMVVHNTPELRCHQCGKTCSVPEDCPECGAGSWAHVGLGTQRLEALMTKWFPQYGCLRVDRDVVTTANQLTHSLQVIHQSKVDIIIGTQMIAKGHDFANVGMVVILDGDSHLFHPDFRAVERLAQTLVQVAGRAGRRGGVADIWVQTHYPHHSVFNVIKQGGDYRDWLSRQFQTRQACQLPPFWSMAIIHLQSQKRDKLLQAVSESQPLLASIAAHQSMMVVGPLPSLFPKRKGYWRYTITLSSPSRAMLHGGVKLLQEAFLEYHSFKSVRWHVDVDPIDLG